MTATSTYKRSLQQMVASMTVESRLLEGTQRCMHRTKSTCESRGCVVECDVSSKWPGRLLKNQQKHKTALCT
eukprot:c19380_g1_i1 orf=767-982(-)